MNADLAALRDLPGCGYRAFRAGMNGGARAELAASDANTCGFPTLAMGREVPSPISSEIGADRRLSDGPCAVNLLPAATKPDPLHPQLETCRATEQIPHSASAGIEQLFEVMPIAHRQLDLCNEAAARLGIAGRAQIPGEGAA